VKRKLSSQQREYVAILGIFAAVVLAFTGGLAFSSSVLTNIDKVSTGKLMMIALTIGVVLISLLFGLFNYIEKLVNISLSPKNIKPLWGYMFVIVVLMLVALFLCYYPVFDVPQATINLNLQF
jgi:SNF family Na+-dependent transporter